MKAKVSPLVAGIIVAVAVAVALFFGVRATGPTPKSSVPVDMGKLMGKAAIAPPARAGAPGGQRAPGGPGGAPAGPVGAPGGPAGGGR